MHVKCNAVPIRSLSVEVLARVPIKRVASLAAFRPQLEAQDRERKEIVIGAIREFLLIVRETEVALPREVHPPLAMILLIDGAEPLVVQLDSIVVILVHVSESRA